ncbi:hypothetical protein [Streptomyces sp. WAC 01438]|uniref:hypothetical protein n=1 Tax=Streptomyces sp. WAC 01438 TaxID=2203204 RepID=UPI003204BAE7
MPEETDISAIRKTLTAAAVATAVLAGSAACGTAEQLSAGQKLDSAFDKLGEQRSLSFELDLDTDAASLKALDSGTAEPGEEMPDEVAELLSGARLSVSVRSKKPLEESGEKDISAMAMRFSGPDGDLVEYRVIGDHTYLRLDAQALGRIAGSPMPSADELPDSAGAFKKLLAGEWLKVPTKDLQETGEQMSEAEGFGADGSGPGSPPPSPPSTPGRRRS